MRIAGQWGAVVVSPRARSACRRRNSGGPRGVGDAADRGVDGLEAIVEPASGRAERRVAVVGQGAAHGPPVGARGLGRGSGTSFQWPFERADAPDVLLALLLGMAIGFVDRLWGLRGGGETGQ